MLFEEGSSFPFSTLHQRVVGFGGRVIREGQPKYLNSPESSIYHKGEVLYGLPVAKRYAAEKDCVIIVEGYFDLLTLHQYGLKHSVATLGTALTPQHIRTLKRYTKNLITVFDADPAGVQATLRSPSSLFRRRGCWEDDRPPRRGRPGWIPKKRKSGRLREKGGAR